MFTNHIPGLHSKLKTLGLVNFMLLIIVFLGQQFGDATNAHGAITTASSMDVRVRVPVPGNPGNFTNHQISVPITVIIYTGDDGATGCNGLKYQYAEVIGTPSWPVTTSIGTFTAEDNKRYWDWTYAGYDGGGTQVWTKNCHGYAFDIGNWPSSASPIIANHGTGVTCWEHDTQMATVAANPGHSMKITMENCPSRGYIIKSCAEKFRESAVYTPSGNCDSLGIDLNVGNGERAGMVFATIREKP